MYKNSEIGRSMIEMLGVLAIIGVLSIGGIAGYTKAMIMWRSNVQRNMLSELISEIIRFKSNFSNDYNEAGEVDLTSLFGEMGLLPEGTKYEGNRIQDKFGVKVQIVRTQVCGIGKQGDVCSRLFAMRLYYTPTSDSVDVTPYQLLCRNVVQVIKPMANEIEELRSWKTENKNFNYKIIYYGRNLSEATVAETTQKCSNMAFGVHMTIVFNF